MSIIKQTKIRGGWNRTNDGMITVKVVTKKWIIAKLKPRAKPIGVVGIEPTTQTLEIYALPLNYTMR